MPNRPPRLERIFQRYDPFLYFITFNTHHRRKLLANARTHACFVGFCQTALSRGIAVGRYVIMPEHVHLFVAGTDGFSLRQWVRLLKRALSDSISYPSPHWQTGFFDHLVRDGESYAEKWEYVRQNPVRGGLVTSSDEWPYQGEIERLEAL